jgi:hypothetical protein
MVSRTQCAWPRKSCGSDNNEDILIVRANPELEKKFDGEGLGPPPPPRLCRNQCVGDGLQTWHGGEDKSLK